MLPLPPAPAWMAEAACRGAPALFFPERGEPTREAITICHTCAVREECLAYALEHREHFGIWGGTSERERRKLRHARRLELEARLVVETVAVNGDHGGIADVDTPAEAVTNGGSPSPTKRPLNPGLAAANERRHAEAVARRTAPPRVAQEARNGKAGGGRPSRPPAVLPLARLVEQAWPLAAQVPPGVKITLAAGRVQLRDTNGKER